MESRISIDLDNDNQPVIKIDYKPSEDVRDKMVKRFMETFGGESWFATFHFLPSIIDMGNNSSAVIRPLPVKDFRYHVEDFKMINQKYLSEQQTISPPDPNNENL